MSTFQMPQKRRRTRGSTAAEVVEAKRLHYDLTEPPATNGASAPNGDVSSSTVADSPANVPLVDNSVLEHTTAPISRQGSIGFQENSGHWNEQTSALASNNVFASQPSADPTPQIVAFEDPSIHLRIGSLPVLENLAVQILQTLTKGSYEDTLNIVTQPDSQTGQAYATVKSLFDQTKKLYSVHEPFLSAFDLRLYAPNYVSIVRKANLATFVSSVFGSHDVGFFHLNESFLDTFVPPGGRFLKCHGSLYLELKTQAYISAMSSSERPRCDVIDDLFPQDLAHRLLALRPGAKQLSSAETDFIQRIQSRRDHLLGEADSSAAIAALPEKYIWDDFLRDLTGYVSRSSEEMTSVARQPSKSLRMRPLQASTKNVIRQPETAQPASHATSPIPPGSDVLSHMTYPPNHETTNDPQSAFQAAVEKAAQAAQAALRGEPTLIPDAGCSAMAEYATVNEEQASQRVANRQSQPIDNMQSVDDGSEVPFHSQSAPTQVLYEQARLAATSKCSPNNRRAGLPSQRRPWTTEEENALMAGLDRVKGPHWSQILAMFGAGGTINESLKDRNQVQLKDKARNLKLFFLKSGIEVPYYLQFVTGELKTRAPSQAARNEAQDKVKQQDAEDRAHVEGILALAGGPRDSVHALEDNGSGQLVQIHHLPGQFQASFQATPQQSPKLGAMAGGQSLLRIDEQ